MRTSQLDPVLRKGPALDTIFVPYNYLRRTRLLPREMGWSPSQRSDDTCYLPRHAPATVSPFNPIFSLPTFHTSYTTMFLLLFLILVLKFNPKETRGSQDLLCAELRFVFPLFLRFSHILSPNTLPLLLDMDFGVIFNAIC